MKRALQGFQSLSRRVGAFFFRDPTCLEGMVEAALAVLGNGLGARPSD
jgi:hypothetical protein